MKADTEPPSRVAMPGYRTNAKNRTDLGARQNSYVDHLLYWAPLRRLTLLLAAITPFAISCVWSAHTKGPVVPIYVGIAAVAALISAMSVDLRDRQWRTNAHFVLFAAYAPLTLVFMLWWWIWTGVWLPPSWTMKKKS